MEILLQLAFWTLVVFGAVLAVLILPAWYWWSIGAVFAFVIIVASLAGWGVPWAKRVNDWLGPPRR